MGSSRLEQKAKTTGPSNEPSCGTVRAYNRGCRCLRCGRAYSLYRTDRRQAQKRGETRRYIPIAKVQRHLKKLSRQGVGYRAVAAVLDVCPTYIQSVKVGRRRKCIREHIAKRILAVDAGAVSDSALVNSSKSWKVLNKLLERGYSGRQLGRWLGSRFGRLPERGHRMTARMVRNVEQLYKRLNEGRLKRA